MDVNLNINQAFDSHDLIKGTVKKISSLEALKGQNAVIDQSRKAGFEAAARGFESLFVHMMLKEMKNAMLNQEEQSSEMNFGANTLQGYTDLLFADHISKIGRGIGIAETLFKQMTGEELPFISEKKAAPFEIPVSPYVKPEQEDILTKPHKPDENIFDIPEKIKSDPQIQNTGSTFLDKMENRLAKYDGIISDASDKYNLPKDMLKAVITAESAGKPDAVSSAGAKGLMQLMDATAEELGVQNSYDPYENIMGGAKYLRQMMDMFGDKDLALAAYNAGPGNVRRYSGIPPFSETRAYVAKVSKYLDEYKISNMA